MGELLKPGTSEDILTFIVILTWGFADKQERNI